MPQLDEPTLAHVAKQLEARIKHLHESARCTTIPPTEFMRGREVALHEMLGWVITEMRSLKQQGK